MLLQKQRKSTFVINALVIGTLAFGVLSLPSDAYGMGKGKKIKGLLERKVFGLSTGQCVRQGISLTGKGVEAISYNGSHLECQMFHRIDNLLINPSWCSQWVVPGAPDYCLPQSGGGGGGTAIGGDGDHDWGNEDWGEDWWDENWQEQQ